MRTFDCNCIGLVHVILPTVAKLPNILPALKLLLILNAIHYFDTDETADDSH